MFAVIEWLDASPTRFWVGALTCFVLTSLSAIAGKKAGPPESRWSATLRHPLTFCLLVLLTMAAFRWPVWFHAVQQNPDEAQMLAAAITLREHPVFWRDVDGTTHGPLNSYFLVAASYLGLPLNFLGVRICGSLLHGGALLLLWGALRLWLPERAVRLGLLSGLAVWAFTSWHDLVQYASEQVCVVLLGTACLFLSLACHTESHRRRFGYLAFCGLFLGMVPFAKLQGVPVALTIAAIAGFSVWFRHCALRQSTLDLASLVGGGVAFPALVAALLGIYGLFPQFWYAYIVSNVDYVRDSAGPGRMVDNFPGFISIAQGFPAFAYGALSVALVFLWNGLGNEDRRIRWLIACTWLILGASFYAVVTPGREFAHYLNFLVVPLTALATVHLGSVVTLPPGRGWQKPATAMAVFAAFAIFPQLIYRRLIGHPYLGHVVAQQALLVSPPSSLIRTYARPGEALAMWGWMPELFVETGLPQGTRDSHTALMLGGSPLQDFYRQRYLRDLARNQPAWFVDAIGPRAFGYQDRTRFAHETFPALAEIICKDYFFFQEIGGVRVYRRNPPAADRS